MEKVLLDGQPLNVGEEKRLFPGMKVNKWDRLHFHVSGGNKSVAGLNVRVLYGTPVNGHTLLSDSTVWFEDTKSERDFSHVAPRTYNGTGFVMSVPVVAPQLYDVIVTNMSDKKMDNVFVTMMTQEI